MWCDRILGYVMGLAILSGRTSIKIQIATCLASIRDLLLYEIDWFKTARPGGIKLHEYLCIFFSTAGTVYTLVISSMYGVLESMGLFDACLLLVSAISICFGLRKGLRTACSLLKALISPISFPGMFADVVMNLHLTLVQILWCTMRGSACPEVWWTFGAQQVNIDTSQYHLATLLFMPVLLTVPTTLWYGYFVSILGRIVNHSTFFLFDVPLRYI